MNAWRLSKDFILASASPRRLELLKNAGFIPLKVVSADIDETIKEGEKPCAYVARVAKEKALYVASLHKGISVVSADTIVLAGGKIIRKAKNEQEARQNLEFLSGKTQYAITGYCVVSDKGEVLVRTVKTKIILKKFAPEEVETLLNSGEWKDAAAYKIQGIMSAMVKKVKGSYTNIVGLPVFEISEDLKRILK